MPIPMSLPLPKNMFLGSPSRVAESMHKVLQTSTTIIDNTNDNNSKTTATSIYLAYHMLDTVLNILQTCLPLVLKQHLEAAVINSHFRGN